jgi:hypothetical protein
MTTDIFNFHPIYNVLDGNLAKIFARFKSDRTKRDYYEYKCVDETIYSYLYQTIKKSKQVLQCTRNADDVISFTVCIANKDIIFTLIDIAPPPANWTQIPIHTLCTQIPIHTSLGSDHLDQLKMLQSKFDQFAAKINTAHNSFEQRIFTMENKIYNIWS